jgi:hypothetical protein
VAQVWIDEFDKAYEEGTMFLLTMHPHISGHRSRIVALEQLIAHIQQKGAGQGLVGDGPCELQSGPIYARKTFRQTSENPQGLRRSPTSDTRIALGRDGSPVTGRPNYDAGH